ncbi:helix-turn-helix transcriptional regulator [Bosea sp. R86505]|uniref:helix-turn-helix transcriptional regulator n=1 Tax=Bosea sp. R86505 TaxID=3101710 RepID=UPI0036727A3D
MPPEADMPGFLAQAARMLLGVSQAWLWEKSGVSRKTINDFENGYRQPKIALKFAIRAELERAGAHFVFGEGTIGVVVYEANGADEPAGAGASIGVDANGSN